MIDVNKICDIIAEDFMNKLEYHLKYPIYVNEKTNIVENTNYYNNEIFEVKILDKNKFIKEFSDEILLSVLKLFSENKNKITFSNILDYFIFKKKINIMELNEKKEIFNIYSDCCLNKYVYCLKTGKNLEAFYRFI